MSQDYKITVNIYCRNFESPQNYRLYVDGDLLTERTYIWDNSIEHVEEHIVVNLEPGTHTFELTPADPDFKNFYCSNFTVNGNKVPVIKNEFTI